MNERPTLILAGYGTAGSGLQLTLEAQQALVRATAVYAIAPPEPVTRHLERQRLRVVDLSSRLTGAAGEAAVEAYIDVAGFLLRESALGPPVALLGPGNPLFLNSLTRFLIEAARERDVDVEVYPAVSIVDALISDLGLDVTARGLQLFDARHLLGLEQVINPGVPLFVLQPGGLAAAAEERGIDVEGVHRALVAHLKRYYPPDHAVSLITGSTGHGTFQHQTRPLNALLEVLPEADGSAALFCDLVRDSASTGETRAATA